MHRAAVLGHMRVARVLLAAGCDVDAREKSLKTPLHEAARHGHVDVFTCLIAAGARLNPHKINNWVRCGAMAKLLCAVLWCAAVRCCGCVPDWQWLRSW